LSATERQAELSLPSPAADDVLRAKIEAITIELESCDLATRRVELVIERARLRRLLIAPRIR
jgi:hypothetical protein